MEMFRQARAEADYLRASIAMGPEFEAFLSDWLQTSLDTPPKLADETAEHIIESYLKHLLGKAETTRRRNNA